VKLGLAAGLIVGVFAAALVVLYGRPAREPVYAADAARAVAAERATEVPLPAGGTFDGIRWEVAGGVLARSDIDGVLHYNAACQWLRAWRDGREPGRASSVLRAVPRWPALAESAGVLSQVVAEVKRGGGETATAMLAECDASHAREVEYAARMGLTPSR
jgi:hypothetical protein